MVYSFGTDLDRLPPAANHWILEEKDPPPPWKRETSVYRKPAILMALLQGCKAKKTAQTESWLIRRFKNATAMWMLCFTKSVVRMVSDIDGL